MNENYLQVLDGSCFQFVTYKNRAYEAANEDCARHGGTLAVPMTQKINDFLADESFNHYHIEEPMWIGLHDQGGESTFIWEEGSPLDWSNFAQGQGPDNGWIAGGLEDCVALDPLDGGQWHDFQCSGGFIAFLSGSDPRKRYICQYTLEAEDDQEETCPVIEKCDKECGLKGYQSDENDCRICECNSEQKPQDGGDKPVGPSVTDEVVSEDTDQQDGEGDEEPVVETDEDSCPELFQCELDCGMRSYKRDGNGCQLCECNEF